jgi:hypothetical protein
MVRDYLNGHHVGKNHDDRPIRSSLFLLGLVVETQPYPSCAHLQVQSPNQCWAIIGFSDQLLVPALGNELKTVLVLVHQKEIIPVAVLSSGLQLTPKKLPVQVRVPVLKIRLTFGLVLGHLDGNQQLTAD